MVTPPVPGMDVHSQTHNPDGAKPGLYKVDLEVTG